MARLDGVVAVIARSPKGDAAIQESRGALRSLDCFVAIARRQTGVLPDALWLLAMTVPPECAMRYCKFVWRPIIVRCGSETACISSRTIASRRMRLICSNRLPPNCRVVSIGT
jgi:hypothetical protein